MSASINPDVAANKALVFEAITGVFVRRDLSVLDRLFAEDYIQHNHFIAPYREGLHSLVAKLPAEFSYEPGMIIGEGDIVMIHGRYSGFGPKPLVTVDIFRIANGKLAEHWDVMAEEVPAELTKSGNAMFTNPQQAADSCNAGE